MMPASRAEKLELYRIASPTSYADKSNPPLLILHGTADKTVPVEQSKLLAEVLKKVGAAHRAGHRRAAPPTPSIYSPASATYGRSYWAFSTAISAPSSHITHPRVRRPLRQTPMAPESSAPMPRARITSLPATRPFCESWPAGRGRSSA